MKSPIDPDAMPIANRSPYRRIDPRHPGRLAVATRADMNAKIQEGAKLRDLEALYEYDSFDDVYWLRKEFL